MFELQADGQTFDGEKVLADMLKALKCATMVDALPAEALAGFANRDPVSTGLVLAQFAAAKGLFDQAAASVQEARERILAAVTEESAN